MKRLAKKIIIFLKRNLIATLQKPRKFYFRILSDNICLGNPIAIQPIQIVGNGKVIFEENVKIGFFPSPYYFSTYGFLNARNKESIIKIGKGTWINNNISIISEGAGVYIGENCLIGANVEILDSDFHAISLADRKAGIRHDSKKVVIGNDVFIGSHAKILKGVMIGDASVIANSAVVTKDVPANSVVGGNPARIIKQLGLAGQLDVES